MTTSPYKRTSINCYIIEHEFYFAKISNRYILI